MVLFCSRKGYFLHVLAISKKQHYTYFSHSKLQLKNICMNQLHLLCPEGVLLADAVKTSFQAGITLQDEEHFGCITL